MLQFSFHPTAVPNESKVCGAIVVPFIGQRCLLTYILTRPQPRYEFVAGHFEPGETAEQIAIREVAEETGAFVKSLNRLGYVLVHNDAEPRPPFPFPDGYLVVFAAQCSHIDDSLRHTDECGGTILCNPDEVPKHLAGQPDWMQVIWSRARDLMVRKKTKADQTASNCACILDVLKRFNTVKAASMAGSHALGQADRYSDLDIQVFTSDEIPDPSTRRKIYGACPGIECKLLAHPISAVLDKSPFSSNYEMDWIDIEGAKCDIVWLPQPGVEHLISALPADPDFPETIGVLTRVIQPLFDPEGYIEQLRKRCPEYPTERARRKAGNCFGHPHWFICDWRVLEKAIYRNDIPGYQQAENEMVEYLVKGLYAVNRVWQESRRRLRFHSREFSVLPENFLNRLEAMILRKGPFQNLESCHWELRSLFHDLCLLANNRYPEWHLSEDWLVEPE